MILSLIWGNLQFVGSMLSLSHPVSLCRQDLKKLWGFMDEMDLIGTENRARVVDIQHCSRRWEETGQRISKPKMALIVSRRELVFAGRFSPCIESMIGFILRVEAMNGDNTITCYQLE